MSFSRPVRRAKTQALCPVITMITKQSSGLKERYLHHLETLEGQDKWKFVVEVSTALSDCKKLAPLAVAHKEIIDSWTDEDYAGMGVTIENVEKDLLYTRVVTPLVGYYTMSEKRKRCSNLRVEEKWGSQWAVEAGEVMDPWPAEELLRKIAVFAQNYSLREFVDAAHDAIQARIIRPKAFKRHYIMLQDLAVMEALIQREREIGKAREESNEGRGGGVAAEETTRVETSTRLVKRKAEGGPDKEDYLAMQRNTTNLSRKWAEGSSKLTGRLEVLAELCSDLAER